MNGWIFILVCLAILIWAALCLVYDKRPRFLRPVTAITVLCIWVAALWTLIRRFTEGLGAVTGMNDAAPWGLWIGADVFAGVALAAGGFVIAATVHIFRIERFEPILRPTVLTAFLGYMLVAVALFIDIGRPLSWWHPLVMWQEHSIMFEVTWCVILYSTVLAIEISPVVLERLGLTRLLKLVKTTTIPVVIAGVILSTMHQSSLGSLYLIVPGKLYPLWYSPLLPVFFLISAVAAGMCVIIVESFFSAKILRRGLESSLMADLGKAASIILFVYLLIKFSDLAVRGAWDLVCERNLQSNCFCWKCWEGPHCPPYCCHSGEYGIAESASCRLVTRHGGHRAQPGKCLLDWNVGQRSTPLYPDLDGNSSVARFYHGRHHCFLSRGALPAGISED